MIRKAFNPLCLAAMVMVTLLTICMGCEHRPLLLPETKNNVFVKIYFDENIRNVSYGFYNEEVQKPEYESPEVMRVALYDAFNNELVTERYMSDCGRDADGHYIQGYMNVPEGRYNMIAYNMDTYDTKITFEKFYNLMTAYTDELSENQTSQIFKSRENDFISRSPISMQPDHLFVCRVNGVEILPAELQNGLDTIRTHDGQIPTAQTIVKTYYMQINVQGVQYVQSAVALLTGMAGSKTLFDGEMVMDDEKSIFFGLQNGKEKRSPEEESTIAYATFSTFGKLPHTEGYIEISFEFNTIYNTVQTETIKVTDMFETPMVRDNQWIIIDKVIEIKPPEGTEEPGGGMQPGVRDWDIIEGYITI